MESIYITHTPYHLLLSLGIAKNTDKSNLQNIIIISDYKDAENYYWFLKNNIHYSNLCFHFYQGVYNQTKRTKKILNLLRTKNQINRLINGKEFNCVYVFNDTRVEDQTLLNQIENENRTNIYVEDGTAIYNSHTNKKSKFQILFSKLIYGFDYQNIMIHGTHKKIDKIYAFNPQLIRQELADKNTVKLDHKMFDDVKNIFKDYVFEHYDINIIESINVVIILPDSDYSIKIGLEKIKFFYEKIISIFSPQYKLAVKYHPGEYRHDYLGLLKNQEVFEICQSIPCEILWTMLDKSNLKIVIGDISTSLMSCRTILGSSTKIISGIEILSINDSSLRNVFQKMGIYCPTNYQEFVAIDNCNS